MSQNSMLSGEPRATVGVDTGLDALRESPTFRGPVEPVEGDDTNDHLALLYETQAEQFGAAIPFIRHGIDRGERCLYVADENSRDDVLAAMRESDMDVDAAVDEGALTLHTAQDTYCRGGRFDPDETVEFLADHIETARADEYTGLRIAAEMTWIFGADPEMETLVEYEEKVNHLLRDEAAIALCQYNRDRFPADVLADVVRAHPHLIYESTVCQNYYYTPPEEFFGPSEPEREVERMVETLRERTEATVRLGERERQLRQQNDRLESFATLVAHELRNPVAIGQIYSQQLPDGADAETVAHVADAFDRIEDMIDILLVVTRGREAVSDESTVHLGDVARAAWAKAETGGATLEVTVDRDIRADETYVEHLFRNLFENAEHGDAETVRVGDLPTGFYVADDGSGIPPAERERVFEVGFTTAGDRGGTGVGLAFVDALAEVYGWTVTVTESDAGGARLEFADVFDAESA